MKHISQVLNPRVQSKYSAKFDSEEWKSFARQIREKRNYACENCRQTNVELQVHELFYDPAILIPDPHDVILLCTPCHKEVHLELMKFRRHVFKYLDQKSFAVLNGALAVALTRYDPLTFCHALAEFVANERFVKSHAEAWGKQ